MAAPSTDEIPTPEPTTPTLEISNIDTLTLEEEFSGKSSYSDGDLKETLHTYGEWHPPVKCKTCQRPIMLFTFYDGFHDPGGKQGRTVLCGEIDPYEVRREIWDRKIPEFVTRRIRSYYCGKCPGSDECQRREVSYNDRFTTPVYGGGEVEIKQDKIQQFNCTDDCKGQCLLDEYVRHIDDEHYSVKSCPECEKPIMIGTSEGSFENAIVKAILGEIVKFDGNFICGEAYENQKTCDKCKEIVGMFFDLGADNGYPEDPNITVPFTDRYNVKVNLNCEVVPDDGENGFWVRNIPEGCTGPGCGGECLRRLVRTNFPSKKSATKK